MNRFKIKPEFSDDFLTQWKTRQSFLSENPGYIRFRLLKSKIPPPETHVEFVSYTEWLDEDSFLMWMNGEGSKKAHASNAQNKKVPPEAYMGAPEFRGYQATLEETLGHRADFSSPFMNQLVERNFASETNEQALIPKVCAENQMPPIQIGAFEGRILEILLKTARAKTGVEIGTLGGYSTSWLARGLGQGGKVYSCELDPKRAEIARKNLSYLSAQGVQIEILESDAQETLPSLESKGPFDFVFIDANKAAYARYAEWAFKNLRSGGLIICDNAYVKGGMNYYDQDPNSLKYPNSQDSLFGYTKNAFKGMSDCWSYLKNNSDLDATIFPTGDGLAVAVKS